MTMMTYERTLAPEANTLYGQGATSETYRSADGHKVKILPGREWINVTLPDGQTERVLKHWDSVGRELVPFPHLAKEKARPFAEALATALGGRIEEYDAFRGERKLQVILGAVPLPPLSLSETDPHDEDE